MDGEVLLDVAGLAIEGPGLVLVTGPTGGGKTTLLRSATGLEGALVNADVEGTVHVEGRVGYLPQDPVDGLLSFDAANEFLLRARARGLKRGAAQRDAESRLASLGLDHVAQRPFHHLSAGERGRVAVDAVRSHEPDILLLDEPLARLDAAWRSKLSASIAEASRRSMVLVSTHDPSVFAAHATRALRVEAGLVSESAPPVAAARMEPPRPRPWHSAQPLVRLEGLSVDFEDAALLGPIDAAWGIGVHALAGPNGSGKTTLLRTIAGLQDPTRGHVTVVDRPVAMQCEDADGFFLPTVEDEIAYAPAHLLPGCDARARAREALFDFELDGLRTRHPYALSGGERMRLALACLAAHPSRVVLLDEPTLGLDGPGRRLLMAFLARRRQEACTLVATHDAELLDWADSVHELSDGRLVAPAAGVMARTPS